MKHSFKALAAAVAFASAAFSVHAATASNLDLVIGFKSSTAANNVEIDLGQVGNYTAPGTYNLGNFNTDLSNTFGSTWSTLTTINWAAAAANYDTANAANNTLYLTRLWNTTAGTLGVKNSTAWTTAADTNQSKISLGSQRVTGVYTGLGNYTLGTANLVAASGSNSWSGQTASTMFNYTASQVNNQPGRLASGQTYSASDLYLINYDEASAAGSSTFLGTFAVYQNGDITFTVIPEPSTYAMILGAMTVGFVALRRRFVRSAV